MVKNSIATLSQALTIKLMALYDIEQELVRALPKLAKSADDAELKQLFVEHLVETENHVVRLEEAFSLMDLKPKKTKVEAIRGIAKDTDWIIKEKPGKAVLDAMLIGAASHAEHYEISGYNTAIKWAKLIGYDDMALLLEENLKEEEMAEDKLATLADERIDEKAASVMAEDDTDDDDTDGSDDSKEDEGEGDEE